VPAGRTGTWPPAASRAAAWLNVSLETERATRGSRRAFIRYDDLLADWRGRLRRAGDALELPMLRALDPERAAGVDGFVDPGLHRNRVGWEDLEAPVPRASTTSPRTRGRGCSRSPFRTATVRRRMRR
jgi:hypothetical protein